MSDLKTIEAENAKLKEQIAKLEALYGLEPVSAKARAEALFKVFDRDSSGFIDKNEFEILAFKLGAEVSRLRAGAIDAVFKDADKKGIDFETFYTWLNAEVPESKSEADVRDGVMKLMLQTKSVLHSVSSMMDSKDSKDSKDAPAATATTAAPAATTTPIPMESKTPDGFLTGGEFSASLGSVPTPGLQIKATAGATPDIIAAARSDADVPSDCKCFINIDFAVNPDASEETLGELVGAVEDLTAMIPAGSLPPPFGIFHSVTVDIVDRKLPDGSEGQVLRLCARFTNDLFTTALNSMSPSRIPSELFDIDFSGSSETGELGSFTLSLPATVGDIIEGKFGDSVMDFWNLSMVGEYKVDPAIEAKMTDALESGTLSASVASYLRRTLVMQKCIKPPLAFKLKLMSLAKFAERFGETRSVARMLRGMESSGRFFSGEVAADALSSLARNMAMAPPSFAFVPTLYDYARTCLRGPAGIDYFTGACSRYRIDFSGLDVFPHFHEIPSANE